MRSVTHSLPALLPFFSSSFNLQALLRLLLAAPGSSPLGANFQRFWWELSLRQRWEGVWNSNFEDSKIWKGRVWRQLLPPQGHGNAPAGTRLSRCPPVFWEAPVPGAAWWCPWCGDHFWLQEGEFWSGPVAGGVSQAEISLDGSKESWSCLGRFPGVIGRLPKPCVGMGKFGENDFLKWI